MCSTAWPPPFTLKKSLRAKRVKLKASVSHGLELVVPLRFNQKHIPRILEDNKIWIEKQLAKIAADSLSLNLQNLPDKIELNATSQTWKIFYVKNHNKKIRILTRPQQELVLMGDIDNKELCKKSLVNWVKDQARLYLPERLHQLSIQTGLSYKNVTIRNQRSRWGSCSATKAINLNYKLIFLPPSLADYIIIHELCHTVHMNHSAKFWRLVSIWDINWKEHSRATRVADNFIPGWAVEVDN